MDYLLGYAFQMSFVKVNISSSRTLSDIIARFRYALLVRFVNYSLNWSGARRYTEDTLKSEHKAMFSNRTIRPHSRGRGHSNYEAEVKAGCNEAKADAIIFGLEAEAISTTLVSRKLCSCIMSPLSDSVFSIFLFCRPILHLL